MFGFGLLELLLVLVVVVLFFGANRLPMIGRNLGSGIQEFRKSMGLSGGKGGEGDDVIDVTAEEDSPREPGAKRDH